ncbi:MAG: hypothetical protein ACO37W_08240 [Prochlorotrichaceae cyanobacterium]
MTVMTQHLGTQATEDTNVVDRLQTEKTVLRHKIQQEGFELGVRSSSKLSNADFRHFQAVRPLTSDLDEDALESLWTFLDFKGYPQQARLHDRDFAHLLEVDAQSRIVFAQSWVDGVLSVWQSIQEQVQSNPNLSASSQAALDIARATQKLQVEDENTGDQAQTEKAVLLHKVQQEGFELGVRCSSKLSRKDFQHFEKVNAVAAHLDEDALESLWTFLDFKGYPQQARLHDRDFAHLLEVDAQSRIVFAQSWLDGVLSVWQAIKHQN